MITNFIGQPRNRVDGRAKVTGSARYAAEYNAPDLVHGVVVSSSIARGKIKCIDASDALALDGVLHVFTHENRPPVSDSSEDYRDTIAPPGDPFRPLGSDEILFSAQPIALVVAESFELAHYAASLVRVEYKPRAHSTNLERERVKARKPEPRDGMVPPDPRGKADKAFSKAPVQVDVEYCAPVEHHNPMEMFATTAIRDDDGTLTVYDKTQGVGNVHKYLCNVFGCEEGELRVMSPFVGGAFGSGLRPQYQVFLAVLAARELKRSVRVVLTRQQMFSFVHRPETIQRVALGASNEGQLQAVIHEAVGETSRFEDYSEEVVNWSGLLYQCDNARLDHKVVLLDVYTPSDMRAPGAAWGVYALECAMDELAVRLAMDPVELRLKNYAERDQNEDAPFSSKRLRECYRIGAETFGWSGRNPQPRSMREGNRLVGWGMAGGVWEATQSRASARAVLTGDNRLVVSSATEDIGTGTYTIMTQIAAEMLGLPIENVTFKLGDSSLPFAPVEGGSMTASTVGSAIRAVCEKLRKELFQLARQMTRSPLTQTRLEDVTFADGKIHSGDDSSRAVTMTEVLRHAGLGALQVEAKAEPAENRKKFSCYSHSAIFAEVKVDEDFGSVSVTRLVSAIAAGRILNPKTARSQIMGGIVWGIGMALEEETLLDHNLGRFMNHNLAEYHVPVNADVHDMEIVFVEEEDLIVNPLGAKGLGELGLVGVASAILNAVHHATGRRIRELPLTPDKVMA